MNFIFYAQGLMSFFFSSYITGINECQLEPHFSCDELWLLTVALYNGFCIGPPWGLLTSGLWPRTQSPQGMVQECQFPVLPWLPSCLSWIPSWSSLADPIPLAGWWKSADEPMMNQWWTWTDWFNHPALSSVTQWGNKFLAVSQRWVPWIITRPAK